MPRKCFDLHELNFEPPQILELLANANLTTVNDVLTLTPSALSTRTNESLQTSQNIMNQISSIFLPNPQHLSDLLDDECWISTGDQPLDDFFGGFDYLLISKVALKWE
jgi:hypothetical protein